MARNGSNANVIVGGILLALAWLLDAATVVTLLIVLPDHQVNDYAAWIVLAGLVAAAVATLAVIHGVIQGRGLDSL